MIFYITQALHNLVPEAKWRIEGETYSGVQWFSEDVPMPTEKEVLAEAKRIKKETAHISLRRNEYPTIEDQLDTLYHGGYDAWKAQIQAVKDKYPKGTA